MTSVSANEIQALLSKAARGAGAPTAQAVAFGQAAVCFLGKGGDPETLSEALKHINGKLILDIYEQIHSIMSRNESETFTFEDPPSMLFTAYLDALPFNVERLSPTEWRIDQKKIERTVLPARLDVPAEAIKAWQDFAARTYVPETEQSRLAGAGAGLSDND